MALYIELTELFNDSDLQSRAEMAVIVAANEIAENSPTAAQNAWVDLVYSDSKSQAQKALKGILAKNKDLSIQQIKSALDAPLQTQVNAIVTVFVNSLAGV